MLSVSPKYSKEFISKVIKKKFLIYIQQHYKNNKGKELEKYLKKLGINWNIKQLYYYIINTSVTKDNNVEIRLDVDNLHNIPNTNYKIRDIYSLTQYGNLEIKGYPLILEAKKEILDNLDNIFTEEMEKLNYGC